MAIISHSARTVGILLALLGGLKLVWLPGFHESLLACNTLGSFGWILVTLLVPIAELLIGFAVLTWRGLSVWPLFAGVLILASVTFGARMCAFAENQTACPCLGSVGYYVSVPGRVLEVFAWLMMLTLALAIVVSPTKVHNASC